MPAYAISYVSSSTRVVLELTNEGPNRIFSSQILRAMGFSVKDSLLLVSPIHIQPGSLPSLTFPPSRCQRLLYQSAPPWAWATLQAGLISYWSDRTRMRAVFIVVQSLCTVVGLLMTLYAGGNAAKYAGEYPPCVYVWVSEPVADERGFIGLFLGTAGSAGCIPSGESCRVGPEWNGADKDFGQFWPTQRITSFLTLNAPYPLLSSSPLAVSAGSSLLPRMSTLLPFPARRRRDTHSTGMTGSASKITPRTRPACGLPSGASC